MSLPGTNTHCPSSPSHELLITIGPQCAGKTSYLANYSKENNEKVVDISMDDIDRTYERISVPMILEYQETGQYDLDWERNVYRQSILMRINEILCTEQLPLVLLFKEVYMSPPFPPHILLTRRYLWMNSMLIC